MTINCFFVLQTHLQKTVVFYTTTLYYTSCSKTCVKLPLSKKPQIGFQDQLSLNAVKSIAFEYSAIFSTFIKLSFVIKIFLLFCQFLTGRFTLVLLYVCKERVLNLYSK